MMIQVHGAFRIGDLVVDTERVVYAKPLGDKPTQHLQMLLIEIGFLDGKKIKTVCRQDQYLSFKKAIPKREFDLLEKIREL